MSTAIPTPLPPYSFIEVRKWIRDTARSNGERMSDVQSRRAARSWIHDREAEQRRFADGGPCRLMYKDETGEDAVKAVMADERKELTATIGLLNSIVRGA